MSAKDNFAQAMKELLNSGDNDSAVDTEEAKAPSSFSSFSQPEPAAAPEKKESVFAGGPLPGEEPEEEPSAMPEPELEPEPVEEPMTSMFGGAPSVEEPAAEITYEEESVDMAEELVMEEVAPTEEAPEVAAAPAHVVTVSSTVPNSVPSGDVTVIAAGTTIVGDLNTAGGLKVDGDIKGNLKVATMLELNGKVIGDIEAEDAKIKNSLVRGNVSVKNTFYMDGTTTVVGDISAKNAQSDGKIKGNLTVEERGHFESHATLVGNLIAGTVIIDEGAMLKGDIAITNAQNENISVDEPEFDIEI